MTGENVARQQWVVVCRMTLEVKKRKRMRFEPRIRKWNLKKEKCCAKFIEEVSQDVKS